MGLLATLLIVMHSSSDFQLGSWVSLFYLVNIIVMLLFARKYRPQHKTAIMAILLMLITLGSAAILYEVNLATVVIYNLSYYAGVRLVEYITNIDAHNRASRRDIYPQYMMEYYTVRETFISSGRLIGYGALMAVAIFAPGDPVATNLLFAFVSLTLIIAMILSITLHRRT